MLHAREACAYYSHPIAAREGVKVVTLRRDSTQVRSALTLTKGPVSRGLVVSVSGMPRRAPPIAAHQRFRVAAAVLPIKAATLPADDASEGTAHGRRTSASPLLATAMRAAAALLLLPHCDSDVLELRPIGSSRAAHVVPMHWMQRVGTSGASVARSLHRRGKPRSGRLLCGWRRRRH